MDIFLLFVSCTKNYFPTSCLNRQQETGPGAGFWVRGADERGPWSLWSPGTRDPRRRPGTRQPLLPPQTHESSPVRIPEPPSVWGASVLSLPEKPGTPVSAEWALGTHSWPGPGTWVLREGPVRTEGPCHPGPTGVGAAHEPAEAGDLRRGPLGSGACHRGRLPSASPGRTSQGLPRRVGRREECVSLSPVGPREHERPSAAASARNAEFILVPLLINYCVIFHNVDPAWQHPAFILRK